MGKVKRNDYLLYFLIAVFIVLVIVSLINYFSRPIDIKEFGVFFIASDTGIGFDLNTSILTFGEVMVGGGAVREVILENTYGFPVEVRVLVSKNLAEFITVDETFIVESGKNVSISVRLDVPLDLEVGNYNGKIRFEMYKVD